MCCGKPTLRPIKVANSGKVAPDYQAVFLRQQQKQASQQQYWQQLQDQQNKHLGTYQQIQKQNQQVQQQSFVGRSASLIIKQKRLYR